jgi:hypothetical protein
VANGEDPVQVGAGHPQRHCRVQPLPGQTADSTPAKTSRR